MRTKIVNMCLMRGDTAHIGITIKGLENAPDAITFSVKQYKGDSTYVFQKTLEDGIEPEEIEQVQGEEPSTDLRYIITIEPEDTERLKSRVYCYDCEFIINGDVMTLLAGDLNLVADVTRHLGR